MFAFAERSVSAYADQRDLSKAEVLMANRLWRILGSRKGERLQEPPGARMERGIKLASAKLFDHDDCESVLVGCSNHTISSKCLLFWD